MTLKSSYKKAIIGLVRILIIVLITIIMGFPLFYICSLSSMNDKEVFKFPPSFLPQKIIFDNYDRVLERIPIVRFVINSVIVAVSISLLHMIFGSLSGFALAKYKFKGRDTILILFVGTMIVPFFIRMIPIYLMITKIGLVDTYIGLIIPFCMSGYSIFLMRQFILPIPDEYLDSARIDGAKDIVIFFRIILPLCAAPLAVLALFTFVFQWNALLWPLIATNKIEMRTIALGLTMLKDEYHTQWNIIAAASFIMMIPTIILYFIAQRYMKRGLILSGVKG